ncbi:MAG: hypothetical protein PHD02_00315 [Bacilli bacterium]|nr:hypothetical protein [Bacilli bacterium]
MNLFSKEKEIIFKITNAILLIWLVAAIVIFFSTVINLVVKEPGRSYTYEEYKELYCETDYYKEMTAVELENNCELQYNDSEYNSEYDDYYKMIGMYTSLANIVIVGGVMFLLNKKKKEK